MPEIKVLPKAVSELIAAGEVVERPSSVIKELVENSIDAGSTVITVEIKNGGVTFMRVTDNGCGIARQDAATAFLRHATSKVQSAKDLNEIITLGFRGEALAAISSVSRIEMITKRKEDEIGTLYTCEGGANVTVDDVGCPDGTTIVVRDLFFNTPARMKFLKKDVTEGNAVGALLDHIALSHPEISFRFIREGKNVFSTPGDGKLMSAIYAVCGKEFASTLIPVEGDLGGIKLSGYVCKPAFCRPKKNAQFVFLNGRYVRSVTVSQALEVAYKNLAMVGKYPVAVLHLTVPYGAVDVNVHPAKTEVRFSDERRIFDCVHYSVKNALAKGDERLQMNINAGRGQIRMTAEEYRQTVIPETVTPKKDTLESYAKLMEAASKTAKPVGFHDVSVKYGTVQVPKEVISSSLEEKVELEVGLNKESVSQPMVAVQEKKVEFIEKNQAQQPTPQSQTVIEDENEEGINIEYIGEAFSTYILVRKGESLFIIDKHAAHERILFNKLKQSQENVPQILLSPEQVVLRGEDYIAIVENIDLLLEAGFEIEDYGDNTVLVRALPSILFGEDVKSIVYELAGNLIAKKTVEISRIERIYETMSCRAAIKAGNLSSKEELYELAKIVLSSKEIMYCPHGRPVAMELKRSQIEKQFGRIQ